MALALLTRVEKDQIRVLEVVGASGAFRADDVCGVRESYCGETLLSGRPLGIEHAAASEWRDHLLFITLNREDFSFVIHLDRQPRTSRRREAQTGSRARSGSRSERTLDAVEHSRTLMEWWPFLIFHRGGLRIKVINNTILPIGSSRWKATSAHPFESVEKCPERCASWTPSLAKSRLTLATLKNCAFSSNASKQSSSPSPTSISCISMGPTQTALAPPCRMVATPSKTREIPSICQREAPKLLIKTV